MFDSKTCKFTSLNQTSLNSIMLHFMWKVFAVLLCVESVISALDPKYDLEMIQDLQVNFNFLGS